MTKPLSPKGFTTAFKALMRNPMRALLTTLGIMIGTAAVIAIVEIGQGSAVAIKATISSMGANNLIVLPGAAASGGISFGGGSGLTLTPGDAEALENEASTLRSVAPIVRTKGQIIFGARNWIPSTINGTTPSFLVARDWLDLEEGEMFTSQDVRSANRVCVIGKTIVRELFGDASPVGKDLRLLNVPLRVVGVLSAKGANMMGQDQDDIVLLPWTTLKTRISSGPSNASSTSSASDSKLYPGSGRITYPGDIASQSTDTPSPTKFTNIDQILAAASSAELIPSAIDEITQLLRQRHRIRPGEVDDFNIRNMAEMAQAVSSTSSMMQTLLLCVALISLLVGGVGIMNIMLVSVTERTREIGLRMAVGAKGRDILRQFLIESVVLCIAGAILGIFLGRLSSYLVSVFLNWPTHTSLIAIIAAVGVSVIVGVAFGFYPAWKASRLDPIEALRYE